MDEVGGQVAQQQGASRKPSRTRRKSNIWRYLRPPWTSLLDRLELPAPQS